MRSEEELRQALDAVDSAFEMFDYDTVEKFIDLTEDEYLLRQSPRLYHLRHFLRWVLEEDE